MFDTVLQIFVRPVSLVLFFFVVINISFFNVFSISRFFLNKMFKMIYIQMKI